MPAPTLANQSSFSFSGVTYTVTSVSVEAPSPEIVNMTSPTDAAGKMMMVKTGDYTSPGRISVEGFGANDPMGLVNLTGMAVFSTPLGAISRYCILDSARTEGRVGDVLRVSFTLTPTDFTDE